jgi:signal transduction histidine kinase
MLRLLIILLFTFSISTICCAEYLVCRKPEVLYLERIETYLYNNPDSSAFYLNLLQQRLSSDEDGILYAAYLNSAGLRKQVEGDNAEAYENFEKANAIYEKIAHSDGYAETLLNKGEVLYNWGKYEEALCCFNEVLEYSRKNHLENIEIQGLNYIGKYYHSKGDFEKSFSYYMQCLKLAHRVKDTLGIVSIQNKIGKHYETLGNYPKSLEYYLMSEKLVHHTQNYIEMATTYNSLGNMYHILNDYPQSFRFHTKALEKRRKMNYSEGIAKSLNNLGEVLVDMEMLDSAMVCFEESYAICQDIEYAKGCVKSIHNQGVVFQKYLRDKKAIEKFDIALQLAQQIGYQKGVLSANYALAVNYKRIGEYEKAILILNEGLDVAIRENVRTRVRDFYAILSEIYSLKKNYKKALDYYRLHIKMSNEIFNLESNNKIAELQAEYEVSLQNRENEVLKKENQINELMLKRKNHFIFFVAIVLSLLFILVIIVYKRFLLKKQANIDLQKLNESIVAKNKELGLLNQKLNKSKDQQLKLFGIISHELRNPLYWFRNLVQMLSSHIDSMDKEMVAKSLNSLNESATNTFHLMDNLLNWSRSQLGNIRYNPEVVDLIAIIRENVALISHYAEFKQIRIVSPIEEEPVLVMVDVDMIKTVIRNLLSNAIKFTPCKGMIEIKTLKNGKTILLEILDNGMGMDEKTLCSIRSAAGTKYIPTTDKETGSGLGLALSKEFIELNQGEFAVESERGKGSVFRITLPVLLS